VCLATATPVQAQHGVSIFKTCESPQCVGATTDCEIGLGHADFFGDTVRIDEVFDIVDPANDAVRVPPAGNLPIVSVSGNTTCSVGGNLPCNVGPAGSVLNGLPGDPNPGLVFFGSNTYVIQADDPDPLPDQGTARVTDLCDDPDTTGCSGQLNTVQFSGSTNIEPCCGNGVTEAGEECDAGIANSDAPCAPCRPDCTLPECGDDIADDTGCSAETCDGSDLGDTACEVCRVNCTCCGDAVTDSGEECDDGNNNDNDGCRNDCILPICGDGIVDAGEECDAGDDNSNAPCAPCRPDCTLPECGDDIADDTGCSNETCDGSDLGDTACEVCRENCTCCGDGNPDAGEQCDDGNNNDSDGCRNTCILPVCGDGMQDVGEECDAGDDNSNAPCAPCRPDCTLPECGDDIADDTGCSNETCDGSDLGDTACEVCRENCTCCGDGNPDAGEQCDDGNNNNADGCRNTCVLPECGDGIQDAGEECDDGNNIDTDGCRNNCMLPDCGDGVLDPGESCDGTLFGDNACESCRSDCTCCGDGSTDTGEDCDDGNNVDDDDCSNTCTEMQVLECRVTGGANSTDSGRDRGDKYHGAGQAGAPGPDFGEWTHHQKSGPDGKFIFHAGTASSPDETFIQVVTCSDPGFCFPARPAPAKQIDFEGVGQFKNMQNPSPALSEVVVGESLHFFKVHIEDLGEPGGPQGGNEPGACPPEGSAGSLANCGCPDFYRIDIYAGFEAGEAPNTTDVIYSVHAYIDSGNYQIHPALR
jgi:cysteine-rich repeat protein